jgi:hypothetical protein
MGLLDQSATVPGHLLIFMNLPCNTGLFGFNYNFPAGSTGVGRNCLLQGRAGACLEGGKRAERAPGSGNSVKIHDMGATPSRSQQ